MQRNAEFHKFRELILLHIWFSRSKLAIIPSISTGKHEKSLEISLESMILGNQYVNIADFGLKK